MELMEDPTPLTFWMSGMQHHTIDSDLPCPAWMVPPTEIEIPTLTLRHEGGEEGDSHEVFDFEGHQLHFKKIFLAFNKHADTPVLVKKIGKKAFALLVREHLS